MNQPHPAQVTPSWYGDSVGHYEGDTLVIDTVGVKIGPFAMVDRSARRTPRLCTWWNAIGCSITKPRKKRKNGREKRMPSRQESGHRTPIIGARGSSSNSPSRTSASFTMPWSAIVTYRRPVLTEWPEDVCAENPHEYYAGKDTAVPSHGQAGFLRVGVRGRYKTSPSNGSATGGECRRAPRHLAGCGGLRPIRCGRLD